ncbi:MAG: exosortase/archaeosortase family protein [Gemmatimonadaceae bacterium]
MEIDNSAPAPATVVPAPGGGYLEDAKRVAIEIRNALGIGDSYAITDVAPVVLTAIAFAVLFVQPFIGLTKDWWNSPEAGHGLLLAPVSVWLAWRSGIRAGAAPNRPLGIAVLLVAVVVRSAAGLAAELFSMRASMMMAIVGLTIYGYGLRQVLHWWLPFVLGSLSIPLPELVTQAMALPLQFRASKMGAALLHWRNVPMRLDGNVIRLPGHELFVTEACSGLRSLTALLSVGVLMSAMVLRTPLARILLVLMAVPIAIVVNGVRVFLTGFLVYFVDPALGQGFMHITEGWLLFLVSMSLLGVLAWIELFAENKYEAWKHPALTEVVEDA